MTIWEAIFQVYKPLPTFPTPLRAACEVQSDASYYCEGKQRRGDFLVFVYTLEGRGVLRVGSREQGLPMGVGFLCRSDDPAVTWYYPREGRDPWRFVWLNFKGTTAEAMVREMNRRYGYSYDIPQGDGGVRRLVDLPARLRDRPHQMWSHEGADLIFNILTSLAAAAETKQTAPPRARMIRQAQRVIVDGIEGNRSISDVAAELHLSREHFSRLFKEQTGETPGQYALRQKMMLAGGLLKSSRLSCKEIAARLGYSNATNFTRAFRSTMHCSPRSFRQAGSLATL
ncbi:MAG: helix-turn-helix transcriptional regulator [Lentisphaerae bacterium]|nr:helix-turn-helix transcriptional regulator [Lentisphaerota bacterium]